MAEAGNITALALSLRLGQLLNNYWSCLNGPYAIPEGLTKSTAEFNYNVANLSTAGDLGLYAATASVNGTQSRGETISFCHQGWLVALMIASAVMTVACLIGLAVCHLLIRGPDLLLNVSNLATRNSGYIKLPPNGTYMDGATRVKLVKDSRVRFGDADAGNAAGMLVVGLLDGPGAIQIVRLRRRRLYD